jgi:hypothetical protein
MSLFLFDYFFLALNTVILLALLVRTRHHSVAPPPPPVSPVPPPIPRLSPEMLEHLQQQATATFEAAITKATGQFGKDLDATSSRLNALIVKLTTDIVERELQDYKQGIEAARQSAIESLGRVQAETLERQKSLQRDLEAELSQRRGQLLERVDSRLGEAAVAYIVESLGQAADLGAQRAWLLDSLERHKADLKKDLADEA